MKANPLSPKTFRFIGSAPHFTCDHPELLNSDFNETPEGVEVGGRTELLRAIASGLFRVKFTDKQEAATVLLALVRAHGNAVAAVPVPSELHQFIDRQAEFLRKDASDLRVRCVTNRANWFLLKQVADRLGIRLHDGQVGADGASFCEKLDSLTLEGDKVPFFSEAKLNKLLGKEDARTVLAIISDAKRRIDPVGAEEF